MSILKKVKSEEVKDYLFSNKALWILILPLIVEQFLAILVGMADSIMIASVGEAAVSGVSLVDLSLIHIYCSRQIQVIACSRQLKPMRCTW